MTQTKRTLKSPKVGGQLKQITQRCWQEFSDPLLNEIHKQLKSFKNELEIKDKVIRALKTTITEQNAKLDQLGQHRRRDSLRISGIPENVENDDSDAAVLTN